MDDANTKHLQSNGHNEDTQEFEDGGEGEEEPEIADFLDATIQDISENFSDDDDSDDDNNNSNARDNDISSRSNMSGTLNRSSPKATDDCLDALLEDGDGLMITDAEAAFFNVRKNELQKQLEEEKRRSKEELEKLAQNIRAGVPSSYNLGEDLEGNGVKGIGEVNDYIGKMGKFDSVTLQPTSSNVESDDDGDNDDPEKEEDRNGVASPSLKGGTFDDDDENCEGLSIDEEDNISNDNDDSDIEFCPTQEEENEPDDDMITVKEDKAPVSKPVSPNAHERAAAIRQQYEARVIEQLNGDSKEEIDDESTSNEKDDEKSHGDNSVSSPQSVLYNNLRIGFDYVKTTKIAREVKETSIASPTRKRNESSPQKAKSSEGNHDFMKSFNRFPIINFIDPTSSMSNEKDTQEKDTKSPSSRKAWKRTKSSFHSLGIFSKLNTILEDRFNSTLQSIRYKNLRTNSIETIEEIRIQPVMSITDFISDPADWHQGALCHIYIAACASLDHYKSKVKPALKAFVSQVDGAGSGNKEEVSTAAKHATKKERTPNGKARAQKKEQVAAASLAAEKAKDAAGSSATSEYLILYIPIHPSLVGSITSKIEDAYKGGGIGLRRRLAAAAGRRAKEDGLALSEGASHEWSAEDDGSVLGDDALLNPSTIRQLSKEHRELYNKISSDFPKGRTCLLSSLLDKNGELAAESDVQGQEIRDFLQTLGKAMIAGFTDRVRRYNQEIRKCKEEASEMESFDWCRYFLVKESLALTYEQLQLPLEALQEYEELEAKLPTIAWPDENELAEKYQQLSHASVMGDTTVFREIVRSTEEIGHLSYFSLRYLFARQSRLLFHQREPVLLIDRFAKYVRKVYFLRSAQCENTKKELRQAGMAKIEAWVVGACWDLKSASESFFSFDLNSENDVSQLGDEEKESICSLIDILNFSRMRLCRLGNIIYTKNNAVHQALCGRPKDTSIPWVPWRDLPKIAAQNNGKYVELKGKGEMINDLSQDGLTPWLQRVLLSSREYENAYIELSTVIIRLNKLVGRFRCAARLSAEQAECYIIRGEFDKATHMLLPTIDLCQSETWDTLLSWRLFRLIYCQRLSGSPAEYLRSLTSCFSPRSASAMPSKLVNILIGDLEAVVKCLDVAGHTWGLSPLLETRIKINPTEGGEIVESSNILRKKVIKNVCYVGDEVTTELDLYSGLPRAITVDEMKVNLMTFEDFVRKHKSNNSVENNTACTLDIGGSICIQPGKNTFKLPWTVMTVGQYVITSLEIKWNNASFMEDYCISNHPALCYDVLPNEPTQSIELNPIFLIPGHVQNVRLFFHAGSDVVCGGKVELFCSKGLKVLEPGTEVDDGKWKSKCAFDLEPCQPDEKITIIVTVQCDVIESYSTNELLHENSVESNVLSQTLQAIVRTSYQHKLYAEVIESGKITECSPMSAILQASVTTLERPALTLSHSHAQILNEDLVIVSATVNCNTPVPFSLKEWNITFPQLLHLENEGDFNDGLFDRSVIEGEELFFGFKCRLDISKESSAKDEKPLLNIVLQDDFGKTFLQVLPLDLRAFYHKVIKESSRGSSNVATTNLSLSSQEGLVGLPVTFKFTIDCSHLTETSGLLYNLSCNDGNWILGGKVRGALAWSKVEGSCSLEFVGIPTRSGTIKTFPSVHFKYASSSSDIKVTSKYPASFLSLAHRSIETSAYLSLNEI